LEKDLKDFGSQQVIFKEDLRYAFDYIITLEKPLLRELMI